MRPASPFQALAGLACLLLVAACSASPASRATTASTAPSASEAAAATSGAGDPSPSGSQEGTGRPAGETDDYTLFTTDRLAALVGQPVHVGDTSLLFGMGCRWDTADGRGGVVIQHQPVHLGCGDIAAQDGQHPVTGVGDEATIGPAAFYGTNGDGPFDATIAAAIVGEGFVSVVMAPAPSDDTVVGLLRDLAGAVR